MLCTGSIEAMQRAQQGKFLQAFSILMIAGLFLNSGILMRKAIMNSN